MPNPANNLANTPPRPRLTRESVATLCRQAVSLAIFGYAAGLLSLFLAMEFIGERCWPLAVLLYLPQRIFLLPLMILLPAALLVEAPLGAYAGLAGIVIIYLLHVPFYVGLGGRTGSLSIKVMTNNYGQNHGQRIQPFIESQDPDFAGLDDVWGKGAGFQRDFPGRHVAEAGQFVFISKAPIESAQDLRWPLWRGNPVAAVFQVPWQGRDLAIYTVHFPTPRGDFAKLAGLGLLRELAGHNRRRSDNMSFSEAMTARAQLARDFASVLAQERRPFIAMGDFNMPEDGYVHRVVSWGLLDCFAQAGRGSGFTFPWDTHNPLTLGRAWLRIDYIFAGPGWRSNGCFVEPERRSQHRAVVAVLSRD
jgi:endonuclease/exonuclease/phosphatase family metal-dependent hydrolase